MDKAAIGVTLRAGDKVHAGDVTLRVVETHKGYVRVAVIAPKTQEIRREHAPRDEVQGEGSGEIKATGT